MRLKQTALARRDIRRMYRQSTLSFGEAQADRYFDGFLLAIDKPLRFPQSATDRNDLQRVRVLPYGSHHIVYRVDADELVIVRVLHGRQDIARYL